MKDLRKALIVSVMTMTVFSMSMIAVPVQVGAAAQAGDLIKMDGLSSVYFLGGDNKRYVFPNESTYFSWYSDFSGVVTVPQSELESYPLGANVTVRPGTKLVKITTDPKVYAVLPGGDLKWVPSEDVAKALWGDDWAMRVIDVPDAFFTNYTIASGQLTEDAYPAGSLIKMADAPDVYYIAEDGKARKVTSEAAFLANRFQWDDIIVAQTGFTLPTMGDDITGAVAGLIDTSEGAGGTPGAGTGLTVSIAGDTPAAGNVPEGAPVDFLKVNLTASNDGAVNVNSITLNAYDLGTATYLKSIGFYKNGVRQGTTRNMSSTRNVTFNFSTPISVAAGQTVTLDVRATIDTGASGNFALGIAQAASIVTNGAVVSGAFPIVGNSKAVVTGVAIGQVTMSGVVGTPVEVKFGEQNVRLAEFTLTGSNEPILWESAIFRNGGTNAQGLVSNLRLLVDGDEKSTVAGLVDRDAVFNLNNFLMEKNRNYRVEVYGDIGIGNEDNTVTLYLRDRSDLSFVGQDFGFGVLLTQASFELLDTVAEGITATLKPGGFTIEMDRVATPAKDVRAGDNNVVLATIKMVSNGENATLNSITGTGDKFFIQGTGLRCNEIDEERLRDVSTGVIYDLTKASGTVSSNVAICHLSLNEEIVFNKGVVRTFQVMANLNGPNNPPAIGDGDNLRVTLKGTALSITGDVSNATIDDITPGEVTGSVMTVKDASLTVTTMALTNRTVVPGASDVLIYQAGVEAGASSDVTITSVTISATSTGVKPFTNQNISRLSLYLNGKLLSQLSNRIVAGTASPAAAGYITFNSLDAVNRVVKAGTAVTLELKADFSSSFTSTGQFALGLHHAADAIIARDKDGNNVAESLGGLSVNHPSRVITMASTGDLKVELLDTDSKVRDTYILAGSETTAGRYMGELKFTTKNERVRVKTLVLGQKSTANGGDIKVVRLYDKDGVMKAQKAPTAAGHVNFDSLNLELAADQAVSYFIGIVAKSMNALDDPEGTATFASSAIFNIASSTTLSDLGISNAITAEGLDSGSDIAMAEASGAAGFGEYSEQTEETKVTTITGSVLNSIVNAMSDGNLVAGNGRTIGKYTFVFDNGSNRTSPGNEELKAQMRQLVLTLATSTGVNVLQVRAYVEGDSSVQTTAVDPVAGVATINLTQLNANALVDGTVTLVITGNITVSGATQFVQSEISDLSAHFTYNGNNGTGSTHWSDARLNISQVLGGTLSN